MIDLERPLKNLTFPATLRKRVDFYEVTGVRALSFRNLLVGEVPPEAGRGQNSPADKLQKRLSLDPWIGKLNKSPSSLKKWVMQRSLREQLRKETVHDR